MRYAEIFCVSAPQIGTSTTIINEFNMPLNCANGAPSPSSRMPYFGKVNCELEKNHPHAHDERHEQQKAVKRFFPPEAREDAAGFDQRFAARSSAASCPGAAGVHWLFARHMTTPASVISTPSRKNSTSESIPAR